MLFGRIIPFTIRLSLPGFDNPVVILGGVITPLATLHTTECHPRTLLAYLCDAFHNFLLFGTSREGYSTMITEIYCCGKQSKS